MIRGYDIVVFSYADWFATSSTPQHLSRLLSEGNRVLYVDMPRSFLRFLKGQDPQGAGHWSGPRLKEVQPNLFVYHAPHRFLPVGRLPFAPAKQALLWNGRSLARLVRGVMRGLNMLEPILWNFSPIHGGAVPHVPHRLLINDIADEWSNYIHYAAGKRLVDWMDCEMTRQADVAFVFSQHMARKRAGLNGETYVIYPAGDVPFYAQARNSELKVPADLAAIPKPVIGAICVVDSERFDPGLVAYLAERRPDWSVVILGPVKPKVNLKPLQRYGNVHVLGDRHRNALPGYLKGFDVALVPYAINESTRGIYPMKLQEYLAAGKPTVSPALPECLQLAPQVRFANTHAEFECLIGEALDDREEAAAQARVAMAEQNTWACRLEERSQHIRRLLEAKGKAVPENVSQLRPPKARRSAG